MKKSYRMKVIFIHVLLTNFSIMHFVIEPLRNISDILSRENESRLT